MVGAPLCRMSPVDAHTVDLRPVMAIDIIHNIVLWHFATCTSVNCLTCVLVMTKVHPQRVKLHRKGCVGSGLVLAKVLT